LAKKRERLLADKIDVTQFMVDFIENYPESFYRYKDGENPPFVKERQAEKQQLRDKMN